MDVFFQKRYALSIPFKSFMDPTNLTFCVIGVLSSSVKALWVLSKKRYGAMDPPRAPPLNVHIYLSLTMDTMR